MLRKTRSYAPAAEAERERLGLKRSDAPAIRAGGRAGRRSHIPPP